MGRFKSFSILLVVFILSCSFKSDLSQFQGKTMGTTYNVKVYDHTFNPSVEKESIDSLLLYLNSILSTYISTSEISLLNKNRSNEEIQVSKILFENIEQAYRIYEESLGMYDVTIYPLVELWGFGENKNIDKVPSEKIINMNRKQVGMNKIQINKENKSIRKLNPLIGIDLSSIAKGYAVDYISNYLTSEGYLNHMVEIGGEIRCKGLKKGKKWTVAIVDPITKSFVDTLYLTDQSVATSGNYNNFYNIRGEIYTHIINPLTGYPIKDTPLSVTVVSNKCSTADGYATALMTLGLNGINLINNVIETECMLMIENEGTYNYFYSNNFKNKY